MNVLRKNRNKNYKINPSLKQIVSPNCVKTD